MDHVIPVQRGGGFTVTNLVAACFPCNSMRGGDWQGPIQETADMHPLQRARLVRFGIALREGA